MSLLQRHRKRFAMGAIVLACLVVALVGAVLQLRVSGAVTSLRSDGEPRDATVVGATAINEKRFRLDLRYDHGGERTGWLVCQSACPAPDAVVKIYVDPADPDRFATAEGKLGGDDGEKLRWNLLFFGASAAVVGLIAFVADLRPRRREG